MIVNVARAGAQEQVGGVMDRLRRESRDEAILAS